jgi:hypothetical protein
MSDASVFVKYKSQTKFSIGDAMKQDLKVPVDEFKAVIRTLLNTAPMPASAIEDKRPRKAGAKRPGPKRD